MEDRVNYNEKYKFAAMEPRLLPSPWWIGHIPFAFQMVATLRPRRIVELGVYNGASFCAFCQAVDALDLDAKCYGIDTWEGDIHMGEFEEALYREISGYCDKHYSDIAVLIRKRFDDAVDFFEDKSVDLLHIDGTHTFEAVSNDYYTWLPKMSERGVILFHDTNATYETVGEAAKDFGVKAFFDSIKGSYPHFEFKHCYGLGVLIVGEKAPSEVTAMADEARDQTFIDYFSGLGDRVSDAYKRQEQESQGAIESKALSLKRLMGSWFRKLRTQLGV
jgi:predicted O-methyltransferase YrrM